MGGRGAKLNKQRKGTPKSNKAQNRQTNAIKSALHMTKEAGRGLHDDITQKHYTYHEVLDEARSYNEYRGGKKWTRGSRKK